MTTALATKERTEIEVSAGPEVRMVAATTPQALAGAQSQVKAWCEHNLRVLDREIHEAEENEQIAKRMKHKHLPFQRLAARLRKRQTYYEKVHAAVDAGYLVIPNFELDLFAVRVKEGSRPRRKTDSRWSRFDVQPAALPQGEGEYVSDQPVGVNGKQTKTRSNGSEYTTDVFTPTGHTEVEFPALAVKPEVMGAVEAAQALELFDTFGLCRPEAKRDPIVVGTIVDKTRRRYGRPADNYHRVTFFVGWWMSIEDI